MANELALARYSRADRVGWSGGEMGARFSPPSRARFSRGNQKFSRELAILANLAREFAMF